MAAFERGGGGVRKGVKSLQLATKSGVSSPTLPPRKVLPLCQTEGVPTHPNISLWFLKATLYLS